ncbi:dihydrolipoamide acetyltransferase family protein [Microbacterium sp. NC79]|uniref:dihydrolipoamide acetyltransferase family protein n=1 Tax=Microbacterium sp. NC79 TaxID=2851009 RepID=UPI001C2CC059|nr:dihydrolipoamide acetyltransferase family protein [Microbacterium sp. NC79]MBV0894851.1 2-oxo acid dehydrogenase subunit E2 [Microbacterium sp. NC79]
MSTSFLLPDLGEGLPEAEIVAWHVAVGDEVALNQTIAEVETAKAIVELPSPYAGTIAELFANAGDVVEVGKPLLAFTLAGESSPAQTAPTADGDDDVVPPNLVGYGAAPAAKGKPARRARGGAPAAPVATSHSVTAPAAPAAAVPAASAVEVPAAAAERAERPRSTPPVRKFARDHGVELTDIAGTGEFGRITRADVEAFIAGEVARVSDTPVAQIESVGARETRTPIKGVRKFTAAAMVQSAFTAPHVTCFHTVDVTATMELIARLKEDRALAGHRIGVMAIIAKAVCLALRATPSLNSRWDEAAGEIVEYHYVNLGIAAATPRGLVVPNIVDADRLTLPDMASHISELTTTAREGKSTPAALSGGTFSISNIGTFGIEAGTPILNPGEAGILAVGAVQRRPWEFQGEIALRDVMTLSLSFDHRLVDGQQGAEFLRTVGDLLNDPGRALLF